jgi:hypothetical protein
MTANIVDRAQRQRRPEAPEVSRMFMKQTARKSPRRFRGSYKCAAGDVKDSPGREPRDAPVSGAWRGTGEGHNALPDKLKPVRREADRVRSQAALK